MIRRTIVLWIAAALAGCGSLCQQADYACRQTVALERMAGRTTPIQSGPPVAWYWMQGASRLP